MRQEHRVIVIGGGIGAAFALARRGAAVTVVESGLAGQATEAGAGIISPWASTVEGPFYDLYAAGAAYYPEVIERRRRRSSRPGSGCARCRRGSCRSRARCPGRPGCTW